MQKVLIIEDDPNIRKLLHYDLKNAGFEVHEEANGKDALQMLNQDIYDVVLLDWMLPEISGLELVNHIREKKLDSILIMLTAKDEETDILDAFEAGVDDYIIKPFSPRVLIARIKSHLNHPSTKKVDTTKIIGNVCIHLKQRRVYINDNLSEITKKEYDLLLFLVYNINIVLTREQLLHDVWGFDYDGDSRIVDVHIFRLRKKLKDASIFIQSIRGVGYTLEYND